METYEIIRRLRIARNMSQTELAHLTGYSDRSSIAKIEAGKVDLSQSKIMLFAKVLGVTPLELIGMDKLIEEYHLLEAVEDAFQSSLPHSDDPIPLSPRAFDIARAYDRADEKSRDLVDIALREYMPATKEDGRTAV